MMEQGERVTSTIIFDFDGTVIVGNGPVLAYAREMARFAPEGFLARAEVEIASFEAGDAGRYRDGYDVVGVLGAEAGVPAEERQLAYLSSRELLGSVGPADPAPGLADILRRIPETTRVILATNAPEAGVEGALASWGILDHFDELIYDTGKPAGLGPIIARALATGPVLSVGDIVVNDLAPATELGADTALVGATAETSPASVTMRATTLAELADQIVAWAHAAEFSTAPTL